MSLSKNITEYEVFPGSRIFIAPTKVKDIVTVTGSVFGGENMLPKSLKEAAGIGAELLDAGTASKTKDVLRESLASRGASISFAAGGDRTHFSGSCLPEDLPFLLKTIFECLGEAAFPASEIKVTKERAHGDLIEEKSDTIAQASAALARLLYDSKHVNYMVPTATRIKEVAEVTKTSLNKYHSLLGKGGLVLAIVGDVTIPETMKAVERSLKGLGKGTLNAVVKTLNTKVPEFMEEKIRIADKTNIDVYFGAAVPITYQSDLYVPFMTLSNMLGGSGFANHLMRTLRERDSLTYVAYTRSTGFQGGADGCLRIWTAFSPEIYEKGVEALRREVNFFFKKGITSETLLEQQDRMVGASLIGLSSTKGLASALHSIGVEGKSLSYVDEYPELIRAVTLADLQQVASLIPLDKLSLAAAGTFKK